MVSSPKPPDPYATAQAQSNANLQGAWSSAIIGNANEVNPYGQVNYKTVGYEPVTINGQTSYVPRQQRTVTLSPEQQQLLKLQNQMQTNLGNLGVSQSSRLQGLLGTNLTTAGLPDWQSYQRPGEVRQDQAPTDRAAIEQAMMSRYNTDAARQNAAQQAQLAARGLNVGSAQYGTVEEQQNRARIDAMNQAYAASGQESRAAQQAYNAAEQQRFQEQNAWTDAANALRGQQLQERQTLRNAPINEITALMSGSQVTVPQFQPYASPQVAAAPIGQYIYDNYNARAQNAAAANQGIFGLAGAGIGLLGAPWTGGGSTFSHMFG
jgi:hypothetical protein